VLTTVRTTLSVRARETFASRDAHTVAAERKNEEREKGLRGANREHVIHVVVDVDDDEDDNLDG
jgi:hypothetical protein